MVSFDSSPKGADSQPQAEGKPRSAPSVAAFSPTVESASRLGEYLINRWVADGGAPLVPADRRDEVVATLNRCMACEAVRAAYTGSLDAGWHAHHRRPPMTEHRIDDIPEELITREGFGALDAATLGNLAHCPAAVRGMHEALTTPPLEDVDFTEAGDWFFDELDAAAKT
mgnify:CR=1 FL=1